MKIRTKTLAIIIISVVILTAAFYFASSRLIMGEFTKLERENAEKNVIRALNSLTREIEEVRSANIDWSKWDETYYFVKGENEEYIKNNLQFEALANLKVNDALYLDKEKNTVFGKIIDFETKTEETMDEEESQIYRKYVNSIEEPTTGILVYEDGLTIYSAEPIIKSDYTGPSEGVLIFGRYIGDEEMKKIDKFTELKISVYDLSKEIPPEIEHLVESYILQRAEDTQESHFINVQDITSKEQIFVDQTSKEEVAGFAILNDLEGYPTVAIKVSVPKDITKNAKNLVGYTSFFIILIGTIFICTFYILIDKTIISRLLRLENEIKLVYENKKIPNLEDKGKDEISSLYKTVDTLIDRLSKSDQEILNNSKQLEIEKATLKKKVAELEKFQSLTSDRELRMIELKKKIEEIEKQKRDEK